MTGNKGCGWQRKIYFNKPEFSYVLGALLGDGCIQKNKSHLCCKDEDFADNFRRMGGAINLRAHKCRRYENGHFKYFVVALNSRRLYPIICNVLKKEYVNFIFISGFIDAEGSVLHYRNNGHIINRIMIYNTDRKLLQDIKLFLHKNSVNSILYKKRLGRYFIIHDKKIRRNKLNFYCLKICNEKDSMLKCCSFLDFSVGYKKSALKRIKKYYENRIEPVRFCDSCGIFTDHYAHGLCEKCYKKTNRKKMIVYLRKYYNVNKNVLLAKQRRYYMRNAERIAVRGKLYYQNHKEQHAKTCRTYYLRNRLKINAYQKGWSRKKRSKGKRFKYRITL